ncbi:hypothetical protein HNR11_000548 [Nesterenkonia sandarakina]|uniref:Uncharacterized protein n=1 Tax=Nesterenkonia sandarakina TaxID=272918 RepID=A0A7Z0E6Y8_9MICC|nr:hypothetical protein [Nesterenkonia sandarakina]
MATTDSTPSAAARSRPGAPSGPRRRFRLPAPPL